MEIGKVVDDLLGVNVVTAATRESMRDRSLPPLESRGERVTKVLKNVRKPQGDSEQLENGSWCDKSACKNLNPEVFYPDEGDTQAETVAKAICEKCVVKTECLENAVATREKDGVRGGLTPTERRRLVRQRRRAAKA